MWKAAKNLCELKTKKSIGDNDEEIPADLRKAVLVVCWEAKPQTQGEAEFQSCHSHGIKMNGISRSCAAQWPWEARVERGIEEDDEMEAVSTGNFT